MVLVCVRYLGSVLCLAGRGALVSLGVLVCSCTVADSFVVGCSFVGEVLVCAGGVRLAARSESVVGRRMWW